jgi:hypothetical protein
MSTSATRAQSLLESPRNRHVSVGRRERPVATGLCGATKFEPRTTAANAVRRLLEKERTKGIPIRGYTALEITRDLN